MTRPIEAALLVMILTAPWAVSAKVIGQMTSAQPLTAARVASLTPIHRRRWTAYLQRSQAQQADDKSALAGERATPERLGSAPPPEGSTKSMPLDRPTEWYGTPEVRQIADNIVSYQTSAGGWGKNRDHTGPPRKTGESFAFIERLSMGAIPDMISGDSNWAFGGTIDNGATTTEMRFLALVQHALPGVQGARYRASFLKGLHYLLNAQFPNGGWPQVYPLQGAYHDAITYNDGAVAGVVELLMEAGSRQNEFGFVPRTAAGEADKAVDRAVAVILASQIVINGRRTGWGQQHDPLTLAPVGARNFEPKSLSSNESATLLRLLMRRPRPTAQIVGALHDGVAWLQSVALHDLEWTRATGPEGRRLVAKPGADPLWSRLYDLKTMRPIFGDRDKTIHDDVNDLTAERRNGYSWYGTGPASAIKAYAKWAAANPRGSGSRNMK